MSNDIEISGRYKKLWLMSLCAIVSMMLMMVALGTPAFAATTRTVAIHPSGTAVPGGYDATYTSMSAMEAAENGDLVALDRFLRVEIVNSDGNWSAADTTAVVFDGWSTNRSAGQYVVIEVMSGARNPYTDGKWSTSHYRLSSTSTTLIIDNDAAAGSYFEADFIGLQVENTGGALAAQVRDNAYHKTIKFMACHFRGTAAFEVLQLMDNGTAEVWFINTIIENSLSTNDDEIVRATSAWSATAYFYNCTIVGGGLEGLDVDQGTITVKNCAAFNNDNTDILVLGGAAADYNASDNSVGTNWVDISPGAEADGWNAAVTDYANGDYRVKDSSSVLYQAGLSQSLDSNVPAEDIAGNARPTGTNPVSIGAFEGSSCATKNLVMVTGDGTTNGDADDAIKLGLFQSWGWTVTAIDDGASQATYDNAAASNDVMYIAESVGSTTVGTKATNLTIPVVVDEDRNWDEFGFASGGTFYESPGTDITILDNSHYITSPFATGSLAVYSPATDIGSLDGTANFASGVTILATRVAGQPSLFVADTGAQLIGLTAPARRVGFYTATGNASYFTSNTETLLKRSLEWAAGCFAGSSCGTNLVMVTITGDFSAGFDTAKKNLFESWGWTVTAIEDLNGDYSGAASSNDVMFISESVTSTDVGIQARDLDIGIFVEEVALDDEMEFVVGSHSDTRPTGTQIDIVDNSHYITSTLSTGALQIYSSSGDVIVNQQTLPSGAMVLAEEIGSSNTALTAFATGATLDGGITAANRRVHFISMHQSDPSNWTSSMETLVKRSLNWAAGCGADGGGANQVPAAVNDSFTTDEDVNLVDTVLTNDTLGDAPNTVSEVSGVSNGVLTLNPDGSFTYDPDVGFSGTDNFTYRLTDNDSETSDATVTITVNPAGPSVPNLDQYSCNMKITIDSGQVSGDLNEFPVLISLTDDSLKTTGCGFMTDVDGDDLIFTNSSKTVQLDHEVEKYDNATGELVAWVEVPFLSGSSNTDIYMYFGNSNVTTSQENPTGVWDANYAGVWHLKEDAATVPPGTWEDRISYDEDDSEEAISSGSIDWGSSDLELGEEGSTPQEVGMRWRNVTIPQGATITSAYIEFMVDEVSTETPVNVTFYGEDADNAAVFANVAYNISSRTKTSSSVAWNSVPTWPTVGATHQSPDIKTIIQEIVNRSGWASGNALVVIATGSNTRTAESHDGDKPTTGSPLLHVEYTTGATDLHLDSTSNDNDGIPNGNTLTASGKIDGAQDFDGANDWIKVPHSSSLNLTGDYSIELWVNYDTWEQWDYLIGKGDDYNSDVPVAVQFWEYSSRYGTDYTDSSGGWCGGSADSNLSSGNWQHITVTYNASTNVLNFYLNGQSDGNDPSGCNPGTNTLPWGIGADGLGHRELDGRIDEVRISNTVRSAAWIQTSYNNQNDPSSFYSVEKNCPSTTPAIAEFSCSIPITIDSSKVSGTSDLINFPVLISLTNVSLKTTANCGYVQNSNGYDIIFSDATQTIQLDHELVSYDGAAGTVVAWVRIPTLSATSDTTINLHYGHSSVCGPMENPTGVWGPSSYAAVWHLEEDPSGAAPQSLDSTNNDNDGTSNGSMTTADLVAGKVGKGVDFDGVDDWIEMANSTSLDITGNKITLSAWVKSTADQNDDAGIINKSYSSNYNYMLNVQGSDQGNFRVKTPTGTTYLTGSTTLQQDQWYFLYGIYDGATAKVYLNGVEDGSDIRTGNIESSGAAPVVLGRRRVYPTVDDRFFTGVIDEARISNVARSTDWMQTEYNNQSDPSTFYSVGSSSCFLGGFTCNRKITVPQANVSGGSDLSEFPLLIKIENDCNLRTVANGGRVQNSNGWDIIFTDSGGVNQLNHELVKYDGVTGDLVAWVKIPTLSASSDTDIYMYYGNGAISCDPSNPTGVWDSNYKGVWHLDETSGTHYDSTSNGNDATPQNGVSQNTIGKIDGADDFDGGNDYVNIGQPANGSLDFNEYSDFCISAWFKADSVSSTNNYVTMVGQRRQTSISLGLDGNNSDKVYFRMDDSTYHLSDNGVTLGDWYQVGLCYDYVSGSIGNSYIYVNGVAQSTNPTNTFNSMSPETWNIGREQRWGDEYFDGIIDEVRMSNTVRSAGWFKTSYDNQRDPSSFYQMSNDTCGGQFGFNFNYCKKVTVDNTQVSGSTDLSDFPLLVNITSADLKSVANGGRVASDQGWDIVFRTSGCTKLEHEIESYDPTTGTLVAWVEIPTLSASADTEVYMYYGDSLVNCPTENPTAVWDSSYAAVWHLTEDPSGTAPQSHDSTSNDNDGTSNGTMTLSDLVDGKIGKGIDFDGSNDWIEMANSSSLDITGNAITLSAWVKSTADQNDDAGIINKSYSNNYNYMLNVQGSDQGNFRVKTPTGTTYLTGSTTLQQDQWYFLYGIYDGATAKVYLNGVEDGSDIRTGNIESSGAAPVVLGRRRVYPTVDDRFFTGVIDEARISNVARSTDWMQTEYNNQSDPGNFYSVGSCFEQTMTQTNAWEEDVQ